MDRSVKVEAVISEHTLRFKFQMSVSNGPTVKADVKFRPFFSYVQFMAHCQYF